MINFTRKINESSLLVSNNQRILFYLLILFLFVILLIVVKLSTIKKIPIRPLIYVLPHTKMSSPLKNYKQHNY
jgi:hypothetical protein